MDSSQHSSNGQRCTPDMKICVADSLIQLVPTCIIVFSSLAFISAECGRQDRRRHFNRYSSEVVVQGESQTELEIEAAQENRLIKPKRTFFLSILRCLGAFAQVGLYTYLAIHKTEDMERTEPGRELSQGFNIAPARDGQVDEDWPLWLPVMHGIVWVYASILSVVSLLHPRLSNPYRLPLHLDIIYLTTAGGGLAHFLANNFGRPMDQWTVDDQISGLSAVVSGLMLIVSLATKPLVPPQPMKGPEKRSRGVINPETRSSLYSRIAFTWLHPMVLKSVMGRLQEADVWAIDKDLRIKTVFQDYLESRKPTVFYTMLHLFRYELAIQYLWAIAWVGLAMVPPFVVFKILEFAQDTSTYNRNEAMFFVASLLVSIVIRSAVLHRGLHMGQRTATKAMGMASGLIYEKLALRKDMDPVGYDITDLVGVDVKHIGNGWKQTFYLMIYPTMFIMATIQLYGYIGHSAWAGGLAVITWYPISAIASFLFSGRFDPIPPKTEKSDALVSDFLANLRSIKYLAWEEVLLGKVLRARQEEKKQNSKVAQPVLALVSVPLGGDLIHAFAMTVILSVFSLHFGLTLTPAILFTTLILVDIQTNAINSLPLAITGLREMLDSVVRVNDFLGDEENDRDTAIIKDREMARRAHIPVIGFVNATFIWPVAKPARHNNELMFVGEPEDEDASGNRQSAARNARRANTTWIIRTLSLFGYSLPQQPPTRYQPHGLGGNTANTPAYDFILKNVTVSFPPGAVSLVTGTKRSGKSALLLALIGEMTRTSGKIYLPRKDYYHGKQGYGSDVAYVAQDPWLEIGGGGSIIGSSTGRSTIRDTILFGTPMDEERYTQVLRVCVLEDDLKGFAGGDMTIIGDKNAIWSMSLKQRISLARAVYSNVSHILMDDCLSYVDVKSRHFIWKNCILGPLMHNKTRILVANQFHVKTYLGDVDYVVGLDQGTVLGHGSVKEILSQGWIRQAPGSSSIPTTIIPGASVPANMGLNTVTQLPALDAATASAQSQEVRSSKSTNAPLNKMSSLSDYDDLDSTLRRETAAGFKVGWRTFGTYVFSLGTIIFLLSASMCLFLSQALFVIRIAWLGLWTENQAQDNTPLRNPIVYGGYHRGSDDTDNPPKESMSPYDYIMIFASLSIARALFVIANAFFMRSGAYTGAERIYARLLHSIAAARLSVFEANAEKAATSLPGDVGGLFSKGTVNGLKDCFHCDFCGLDVKLAKEFWQFSADFVSTLLIIAALVYIQPFFIVPFGIVTFMLCSAALLGLGLSKEMHRMAIRADRMNKDQFKHTFRGLATIRGYGLERRAIKAGIAQAEVYLKTAYFGTCADRWLHWKVDLSSAFVPFSCAIMVLQRIDELNPILMGLSLYLSLQFGDKALDTLLGYGRIRNRLQWSLERTRRYIKELDSRENKEAPRSVPSRAPPAAWPHSGAVEFVNFACGGTEDSYASAVNSKRIVKAAPPTAGTISDQTVVVEIRPRSSPGNPSPAPNVVPYPNQALNRVSLSNDLYTGGPRDSNSIRTNTGVSAVNTVASNTSYQSTASGASVASGTTVSGNQQTALHNSNPTFVPLPTPSATFVSSRPSLDNGDDTTLKASKSSAMPDTGAPIDQLEALNQTEPQLDISASERYDAPLPPLPPSAPPTVGPSAGAAIAAALKNADQPIPSSLAVTTSEQDIFGPIDCTILPGEKIAVVSQSKSEKSIFIDSLFRIWDTVFEDSIRNAQAAERVGSSSSSTPLQLGSQASSAGPPGGKKVGKGFVSKGKANPTTVLNLDLGMIKVDGLDISQLGLHDLRSRIAYLSQRGTVFAGTVRFNLDPFGEHEDSELNELLRICSLSERLKLDTELITPASASLSSVVIGAAGPTTANGTTKSSRFTRYKKKFFRRSRMKPNSTKGKGKKMDLRDTISAPATVSAASGRALRAATMNADDLAAIHERLATLDEEPEGVSSTYGNDSEDSEDDDDTRIDLDTNERQLLSLARILVQRCNIVVLDNASTKVTDLTAQRIDQIILQEMKHATVISIGHRLDQIVTRHDRIMLLEQGRIAEFDTPATLLNKPNGKFRAICNPNGPNFSTLVSLAKKQQLN